MQQERQAQLEEQARRKEIAAALKKKGEEEMTARIALEMKRQIEVGGTGCSLFKCLLMLRCRLTFCCCSGAYQERSMLAGAANT